MSNNHKIDLAARDPLGGSTLVNNHSGLPTYSNAGYTDHSHSSSDGQEGSQASPVAAAHTLPHGYGQVPPVQNESYIHPELRSSGEAAAASSGYPPVPNSILMPVGMPAPSDQNNAMSGPLGTVVSPSQGMDSGDSAADGRKAKRELSQSKRAAQNRAAQRAFRQRKEGYIKKLEQQVREYTEMETNYKSVQTENYALREYIIHLQSRLLDTLGEYPQPPPNVNLSPPQGQPPNLAAPDATQPPVGTNPLEVAAQAVAGLSRSDHYSARAYEQAARADDDARTAEEITRQLADSSPDGLPAAPM